MLDFFEKIFGLAIHLLASVYNDFDAFAIRYIYTFVLIVRGRSLTLLLTNQFRALIRHLDSRTCTEKPYWYYLKKITTFCWLG